MNLNHSSAIAALALLMAAGGAFAQSKKTGTPLKAKTSASANQLLGDLLPVDPNVVIGHLPNGLTYYIRKNTQPKNRAELYLVNKAGSILETEEQRGLAHFTEHMAFNGTRDFPKNELVNFLQKSGVKFGADLNAYTSFDETVYQLPLPTDSAAVFEKGFDILANWAGMVSFDTKEIDLERGVVLEEERLRGKNAGERMQRQIIPLLLNHSRYAERLPIGKEEVLRKFKPETIKAFYHDWYRPDLQAVIAVGDFDPKQVEAQIKKKFSELKNPVNEKPRTVYHVPPATGTAVKIVTDKEFPYNVVQIYIKHPSAVTKTKKQCLKNTQVSLFNLMMNLRLSELLQKPNPPYLFAVAGYDNFFGNQDAFTTVAVAKNTAEIKTALTTTLDEVERARKYGFTETEFERAKSAVRTALENAYKERDKTQSVSFVQNYQGNFLRGEAIPGIDFAYAFGKDNIGKIKLSDINALADQFIGGNNRTIVLQAPEKDKSNLPTEQMLLNWIKEAGHQVTAYVDNVSKEPLLNKAPTGSKVVAETKNTTIGTTMLTLGNGVKVVLKPTDFKNDQILISGYSLGGTSLSTDTDYPSAILAANAITSSGISKFNQIQLSKMLSGKNVWVSPFIAEATQGINASAAPKDFETALQLIYLYFTQPRKDADVWQSNMAQTKSVLANRSLDPNSVYQDTVSATLANHNMRRMSLTAVQYDQANLDKAFDFYKARFADASGFTFTMVGNFDVEKIKPLLEQYLGALPATHSKETFKNLGIHAPAGKLIKEVYRGIGDKSNVQLVFSGDYEYNEENNLQLGALEEILNIKLTERLREKESGVYSPGVSVVRYKLPMSRFSITVYFTCAPANVDKLVNATIEEIDKIKKNGAEAADIQKFVAEEKRSTEVALKENGFWINKLSSALQNDENPDHVLQYITDLQKVTVQSTKDAANKYLSGNNVIKFILYPEKK